MRFLLKLTCFVVASWPLGSAAVCGMQAGDITVLRSDERSAIVEFRPEFVNTPIAETQQKLSLSDFIGSVTDHNAGQEGKPDIRYRALPFGFPSLQGNVVQVVASDYEEISNMNLAPVPKYRIQDDQLVVDSYQQNQEAYSQNRFLPEEVAILNSVQQARSMCVGSVNVYPVQYNPATKVLRKYSRIVVEVVFGSPAGVQVQNDDDVLFKDMMLNYNVARSWKFEPARRVARIPVPSVLSSGDWYRMSVTEEGVYRLDAQYLAAIGINIGAVDPHTIKVYGNGGRLLSESPIAPRPVDLIENAILVQGEEDGQFNAGDAIVFYAKPARGWAYDASTQTYKHYTHYYSDVNYYWLTFGGVPGKRMQVQPSVSDSPIAVPDRFTDFAYVEEEKINFLSSGKAWYGQSINVSSSFTHVLGLPGLVLGDTIRYRGSFAARSSSVSTFTVRDNGDLITSVNVGQIDLNGYLYARGSSFDVRNVPSVPGGQGQLNFSFQSSSNSAIGWIDWAEIHYSRRFDAVENFLRFRSPNVTGVVEYRLTQFSSLPLMLNVTAPEDVKLITGAVGSYTIRTTEAAGQYSEYCAAATGSFRLPVGVQRIPNQNLQGLSAGADFIILTSREFRAAANRLAAHREQPAYGNLRTLVVEVDSIYNEFSGGVPDISAIRDFLKYAYDNWTLRPRFTLMLGGGSFDYKGILGSRSNYVPTWESLQSLDDIGSYATDDFFVKFGTGDTPFLATGRISSRTVAEANAAVDKLIRYDNESSHDGWAARMLFVGDDSWTPDREEGTLHSQQSEDLANLYTPNEFDKRKIFIAEYPTVNTPQGRRKPGAYQSIIDEINRGALIVNFTGHGNPTVWAHEAIFSVPTSIPQLVNANKLSVFFAATCNFSQFDDARRYTGSELLLNKTDGGAIGVVSATRKVFAGANADLHQRIFRAMFTRDSLDRLVVERPGTALYVAKVFFNSSNDQKFFYMGDPSMKLRFPVGYASIDSINAEGVDSVDGFPRTTPIRLSALSRVTLKGIIREGDGRPDDTFNGQTTLALNDATRRITIVGFYPGFDWSYIATGSTIYRGQASVHNGRFAATFVVPKDISYADSTGKVVAYFTSPGTIIDGLGYTSKVRVGGTDTTAALDTQGPNINLFLDSRSFRSGDPVGTEPTLYVDMTDSSGINTSIAGIGHRIEAWVNNSSESRDLTEFYTSQLDNYQAGNVQYPLRGLPQGKNHIRVRAWDTYNNSAMAEAFFDVTSTDQLRISDVMNYPNPFASNTSFTFRQNQLTPLNIAVKVYTLAGRLIQSIDSFSPGEPFIQIPWDGRDRDGDVLANGVYLYKIAVKTTDGRFTSEVLGKLAVLK